MAPTAWVGLGFVATAENASPDVIADMRIDTVAAQVCFGRGYPEIDPDLSHAVALFRGLKLRGVGSAGWAWCCHPDSAEDEAAYHASVVRELGLSLFIANMEEPYDAHGNSNDPRMYAPDRYAQAFRNASDAELGLTTTPRWGSSGNGFRAAGATIMPQAFTGEVPSATIPACVQHARAWGWGVDRIRPLVQVYEPRPSAETYYEDSKACDVGVIPYVLEQAQDPGGFAMIQLLFPAIKRPPAPPPPPPAPNPPTLPFRRALYPPDAIGKPHYSGNDVIAVKRAISRAGYWPWTTFSNVYSNAFAHGYLNDRGVAGFQKDHVDTGGKPPTGWYGPRTHEALRTYLIPSGPNKGQYAFDAKACALYKS